MKYSDITEGIFIDRPNRFIANVEINATLLLIIPSLAALSVVKVAGLLSTSRQLR